MIQKIKGYDEFVSAGSISSLITAQDLLSSESVLRDSLVLLLHDDRSCY